ncbi:unnamed protein product [Amoebophrya sp. A120]|nr:unnamed protein product [Amoebophrya sp. A120]|eukprot:GSA120T00025164001.1
MKINTIYPLYQKHGMHDEKYPIFLAECAFVDVGFRRGIVLPAQWNWSITKANTYATNLKTAPFLFRRKC